MMPCARCSGRIAVEIHLNIKLFWFTLPRLFKCRNRCTERRPALVMRGLPWRGNGLQ